MTNNNEMPDEIYVRCVTEKTLSAVRPDSPIAQAEWAGRLKRTKYIRADLTQPAGDVGEALEWLNHLISLDPVLGGLAICDEDKPYVDTIKRALSQQPVPPVYHDTDYSSPLRPKRLEYTMCGKIYAVQDNGERHMFMDVRGWGYLTGGGAKKLPYEEAEAIQDKWANEVCNLWNNATAQQPDAGLLAACKKAADIFRDYERIHLSKTPPDRAKAERNGEYAYAMEEAISRAAQKEK